MADKDSKSFKRRGLTDLPGMTIEPSCASPDGAVGHPRLRGRVAVRPSIMRITEAICAQVVQGKECKWFSPNNITGSCTALHILTNLENIIICTWGGALGLLP